MATISIDRLHAVLQTEIQRRTPQAVQVRYVNNGETELLRADADEVTRAVAGRSREVTLGKVDAIYLVEHGFIYALIVEISY